MSPLLRAVAPDESTVIEVLDPDLRQIPTGHNLGGVTCKVEPGVYAVRFRRGLAFTEKVVIVGLGDDEVRVDLAEGEEPVFATAAPLAGSSSSSEAHSVAADRIWSKAPVDAGVNKRQPGTLLVFLRADPGTAGSSTPRLDSGILLLEADGSPLLTLEDVGEASPGEGWAGAHLRLGSGMYRLRRRVGDGTSVEQALYVRNGWQTQFFALAASVGEGERQGITDFARVSVLMAHEGSRFQDSQRHLRHTEAALRALRERSSIPGPMSDEMVSGKFANPMLGILAGLLQLRREKLDFAALRELVEYLLVLVGPWPDVLAIALAMMTRQPELREDKRLRSKILLKGAVAQPPFFNESWQHIVEATQWEPTFVQVGSLAARVAPRVNRLTPWFQWRVAPDDLVAMPLVPESSAGSPQGGFLQWAFRSLGTLATGAPMPEFSEADLKLALKTASVGSLGLALKMLQGTLATISDPSVEVQRERYDDPERRLAYFVYPLADPLLRTLLEEQGASGREMTEAVLERGADPRLVTQSLQLPLASTLATTLWLDFKLSGSVLRPPSEFRLIRFVTFESRGNEALRRALEELQGEGLAIRHAKSEAPLRALQLFVMFYRATEVGRSEPAVWSAFESQFISSATAKRVEPAELEESVLQIRQRLAAAVARAEAAGLVRFVAAPTGVRVTSPQEYQKGQLFPPLADPA